MAEIARLRTIKATVEYFKQEDNQTPVNEYMLRRLIKEGTIPVVKAGTKQLISLEKIIEYFNQGVIENQVNEKSENNKIRRVNL